MLFIIAVFCFLTVRNASSASFITPCKTTDTTCALASAVKAVSKFADVYKLDPLFFDKVDSSSPNIRFIMNDVTVADLKDCEITKLERDALPSKMSIILVCSPKLDGQYQLTGSLLNFNVTGNGKIHCTLDKAVFELVLDMITKTGADGKTHWHFKRFHHKYSLPNKSKVTFENLSVVNDNQNGDIEKAINQLIDDNSNEIVIEIGGNMILETLTKIVKGVNQFFYEEPVEDLVLD